VTNTAKPSLSDLLATARVVSIPLKHKFRGIQHREAMLFEGSQGWTEWSPFLEYEDEEAAVWLAAAVEYGFAELPKLITSQVQINATLGAIKTKHFAEALEPFGEFKTVKMKVAEPGQTIVEDLYRVLRLREFYPDVKIRIDANGGYSVQNAIEIAKEIAIAGIELEYFEQPVATLAEMAEVRLKLSRIGIKVAADESVRKVSDPLAVSQAQAADVLILKAQPLGGISNALAIAKEAGLPVTISSALETSIGISMGLHLAAALEVESFDAGLGTVAMFEDDVCDEPYIAKNGLLYPNRAVPSEEKLSKLSADADRTEWWKQRLERCYRLI
jgi:O-succinylbenzoate synthase